MSEADRFDTTVRKLLSVSREEMRKREAEWKHKQAEKKRAKISPASHVSVAKG
jgi:hypothetical protein